MLNCTYTVYPNNVALVHSYSLQWSLILYDYSHKHIVLGIAQMVRIFTCEGQHQLYCLVKYLKLIGFVIDTATWLVIVRTGEGLHSLMVLPLELNGESGSLYMMHCVLQDVQRNCLLCSLYMCMIVTCL